MIDMNNILLFEPRQQEVPHLVFVLKLAGIECTVAVTAEEALNWVTACEAAVIKFDLILLNFLQGSGLEHMLLSELCRLAKKPVVYVDRQVGPVPDFLKDRVICSPDDLLSCLENQLNTPLAREKHNEPANL